MKELRPYQQEATKRIIQEWDNGTKRTLLVMATGTGKTTCFSAVLNEQAKKGHKELVIAHRGELLEQAQKELQECSDLESELEKADAHASGTDKPVVVASVQTLCREERLAEYPRNFFQDIVVDEAHHCLAPSYKAIFDYFKDANVLGVTATPNRGDHQKLSDFFQSTAFEYDMVDGIRDGYLCPIKIQTIPLTIDITDVKQQSGDFSASELGETLDDYLELVAERMKSYCKKRKTLVFLPLVRTSQQFTEILNRYGFKAAEINGMTPNRKEILEDFANGTYNVLCNAMLLTEGWNCPEVDCIIVLRPTRSESLYRQIVGRGMRIAPKKTDLLLLDFLWLSERYNPLRPSCLVGSSDEVVEKMNAFSSSHTKAYDLLDLEKRMERSVAEEREKALKKALEEAKRRAEKERRFAEEREEKAKKDIERRAYNRSQNIYSATKIGNILHEYELSNYVPIYSWELERITSKQVAFLTAKGIEEKYLEHMCKGLATKITYVLISRSRSNLCTYKQAKIITRYSDADPLSTTFKEASVLIDRIANNHWKHL